MPRSYSLGKRAVQQAETRRRIVDAALALYQEQGVSTTTMQDIARRADVAPGTVANHFGSREALAAELSGRILADLQMPTPDLFDGVEGLPERIHLMVRELAAFFERSEPWWRASQRETSGPVLDRRRATLLRRPRCPHPGRPRCAGRRRRRRGSHHHGARELGDRRPASGRAEARARPSSSCPGCSRRGWRVDRRRISRPT